MDDYEPTSEELTLLEQAMHAFRVDERYLCAMVIEYRRQEARRQVFADKRDQAVIED